MSRIYAFTSRERTVTQQPQSVILKLEAGDLSVSANKPELRFNGDSPGNFYVAEKWIVTLGKGGFRVNIHRTPVLTSSNCQFEWINLLREITEALNAFVPPEDVNIRGAFWQVFAPKRVLRAAREVLSEAQDELKAIFPPSHQDTFDFVELSKKTDYGSIYEALSYKTNALLMNKEDEYLEWAHQSGALNLFLRSARLAANPYHESKAIFTPRIAEFVLTHKDGYEEENVAWAIGVLGQ